MKIKTSKLSGPALDWAVAKCEEPQDGRLTVIRREDYVGRLVEREVEKDSYSYEWWAPSQIWSQAGPIIELMLYQGCIIQKGRPNAGNQRFWVRLDNQPFYYPGSTPLIAAMRCYVASKLDDTVDIPDSLL